MQLLIDANVVVGYFFNSVLEKSHSLTDDPEFIYLRLENGKDTLFLDDGGQIKQDWLESRQIDEEWFNAWYPTLLIEGKAYEVPVKPCPQLQKRLSQKCGFGNSGRDKWYVRTAYAVAKTNPDAIIVSEDMDLHEPRRKGCPSSERYRIMTNRSGKMVRELKRKRIHVHCVKTYHTITFAAA